MHQGPQKKSEVMKGDCGLKSGSFSSKSGSGSGLKQVNTRLQHPKIGRTHNGWQQKVVGPLTVSC
jgi:hypothetical protein